MKKWNLVIDVAKCFNCNCCALALHDEYCGNSFPGYCEEMPRLGHRWLDIRQREQGEFPMVDVAYLPVTCNHCDEPGCMKGAPEGAITKRADGIVIFDPVRSKGHEELVNSCPYGMIWSRCTTNAARWCAPRISLIGCRPGSCTPTHPRPCTTRWASRAIRSTAAAASTS